MEASSQTPNLTELQMRVLRVLRESDADGFTLLKRTGLKQEEAEKTLAELVNQSLINVEGSPYGEQFRGAYFWVRPEKRPLADFITGRRPW